MVGECLARFGTAEFTERSNSSRAINTKDYATLLTQVNSKLFKLYSNAGPHEIMNRFFNLQYLEAHGLIFSMEFIAQLPQNLQVQHTIHGRLLIGLLSGYFVLSLDLASGKSVV